jgi:predicted nucleic acid-binding Zn ribbon protein
MPNYTYTCLCGSRVTFRTEQRPIAERDARRWCQRCHLELIRQIDAPAFHLKGTGFYVNDYKRKP